MARCKDDQHRNDARWIIAKSSRIDAHGRRYGRGERVFYYPVLGEIASGARAEQAALLSIVAVPVVKPRAEIIAENNFRFAALPALRGAVESKPLSDELSAVPRSAVRSSSPGNAVRPQDFAARRQHPRRALSVPGGRARRVACAFARYNKC